MRLHFPSPLLLLLLLLSLNGAAGCGPGHVISQPGPGCSGQRGILLLDWTVHGAPASSTSCSGIQKLTLFLNSGSCGEVEIDPIACTLDKFRYDTLPEGPAEVILQGVDANGVLKISGSATVDLTSTVPSKPTPVALK